MCPTGYPEARVTLFDLAAITATITNTLSSPVRIARLEIVDGTHHVSRDFDPPIELAVGASSSQVFPLKIMGGISGARVAAWSWIAPSLEHCTRAVPPPLP